MEQGPSLRLPLSLTTTHCLEAQTDTLRGEISLYSDKMGSKIKSHLTW